MKTKSLCSISKVRPSSWKRQFAVQFRETPRRFPADDGRSFTLEGTPDAVSPRNESSYQKFWFAAARFPIVPPKYNKSSSNFSINGIAVRRRELSSKETKGIRLSSRRFLLDDRWNCTSWRWISCDSDSRETLSHNIIPLSFRQKERLIRSREFLAAFLFPLGSFRAPLISIEKSSCRFYFKRGGNREREKEKKREKQEHCFVGITRLDSDLPQLRKGNRHYNGHSVISPSIRAVRSSQGPSCLDADIACAETSCAASENNTVTGLRAWLS